MIPSQQIVEEALSWKGTPFIHQGRLKGVRVDCVGHIILTGIAVGVDIKDYTNYGIHPVPNEVIRRLDEKLDATGNHIEPGCVICFLMGKSRVPQHLGIYTFNNTVVHSLSQHGKVVEHGLDGKWERRIFGTYRYKGVSYG